MTTFTRYPLSDQVKGGLKRIAEYIDQNKSEDNYLNLHQLNICAIYFAVNIIEARINEFINVYKADNRTFLYDKIDIIIDIYKKTKIKDKYNLICSLLDEDTWNSSKEPFQSFEIIEFLRNEFIHYKGEYQIRDKLPPKKVINLSHKIGVTFPPNSLWINDVLGSNKLAPWIYDITDKMEKIILDRLLNKMYG